MRILIVTPFKSGVGSSVLYSEHLSHEFIKAGYPTKILEFSTSLPSGVRHLVFLFKVLKKAPRADIIFSLDHFSVGLPAAVASLVLRKKFFVRVGGDFLWEQYVNKRRLEIALPDFYEKKWQFSWKERCIYSCTKFVFRRATKVIFSTTWQKDIFLKPYKLNVGKTAVIDNVFPKKTSFEEAGNDYIWAGRMIFLKNLYRLIDAFTAFKKEVSSDTSKLSLIGEGPLQQELGSYLDSLGLDYIHMEDPLSHDELQNRLKGSYALILPSLSEVSPNLLAEAVAAGRPFIATRFTGYYDYFKDIGIFVDPLDINSIKDAFVKLSKLSVHEDYKKRVAAFSITREWNQVAADYLKSFQL